MKIGAPFNTMLDKLLVFCILTGEVGKPASCYIEDFIYNFSSIIGNGNWLITDHLTNTLSKMINNSDSIETEGGISFYIGIQNNWTKDQLREYIDNYKYITKDDDIEEGEI